MHAGILDTVLTQYVKIRPALQIYTTLVERERSAGEIGMAFWNSRKAPLRAAETIYADVGTLSAPFRRGE